MKHKHADLMLAYAQDAQETQAPWKLWQFKNPYVDDWSDATSHPSWDNMTEYRRKPRTIRIGAYDVPEPLRVAPLSDTHYYAPHFGCDNSIVDYRYSVDSDHDNLILKRGMMHLTREAAEIHAKALISLTELTQ